MYVVDYREWLFVVTCRSSYIPNMKSTVKQFNSAVGLMSSKEADVHAWVILKVLLYK